MCNAPYFYYQGKNTGLRIIKRQSVCWLHQERGALDIVVSSVLSALNKMCSFAGAAKANSKAPESASVQSIE